MGTKDPRVDAYLARVAPFAQPILAELRKRVHANVPGVEETIRWSAPYFQYGGTLLAGMSAFKAHCAFGFWHPLMREHDRSLEGMGQFGKIASIADLPSAAAFARLAKKARRLVDEGAKAPPKPKGPRKPLILPADLEAALASNRKARATYDAFSYSHRKEYVEWVGEAKRAETRRSRVAQAVEWLAAGKSLHWKYLERPRST